ncbi:hypothetical protein [Silvimonas amylolytica]|uniref:Uncharacterized protein n=1 Tax=Silvimonas amylolytica TaxID=449663 RepID=A0ABQ2PI52_9NEIS|nr:hypothetical protein [Silvimonas amylolytica]GGP25000.1 hypothetical protein GCM10010971_08190 [Silvimonas amylolytica]
MPGSYHAHADTPAANPGQVPQPEAMQDHYLGSVFSLLVAGVAAQLLEKYYDRKNRKAGLEQQ